MYSIYVITVIILKLFCVAETHEITEPLTIYLNSNCTINDLRNTEAQHGENDKQNLRVKFTLEKCNLPEIPNSLFIHYDNIVSININESNVAVIDSYALNGLHHLDSLSFVGNNLTKLQSWSSHNLDQLHTLDLKRNAIRELDEFGLNRYPQLEYLDLSDNVITNIPDNFFGTSSNIKSANFQDNFLKRIGAHTFKSLLRLKHLYLQNNQISHIDPYAFTTTAHLETLRLDNNRIAILNTVLFYNLPRLVYLNVSQNALQADSIEENVFYQNVQLKTLDISYNSLAGFHINTFAGLKSLKVFNASHNQLMFIQPSALKDFDHVTHFDISVNNLSNLLDNQFAFLESIEYINISYNTLAAIQPFTFTDLHALQHLDLSHNFLHADGFLQNIVDVNFIDLSYNRFVSINLTVIGNIGFGSLKLIGNPWLCSWLVSSLVDEQQQIDGIHLGREYNDIEYESAVNRKPEQVDCYDYKDHDNKQVADIIRRHIVIVHPQNQCTEEIRTDEKKNGAILTYPRSFSKLLSDEFDYKACLLWTVIAVFIVIGLIRMGKYCLDKSEKKSERYRISQQEKVLKDIDEYFARSNNDNNTP